jgi:hypothetical protein
MPGNLALWRAQYRMQPPLGGAPYGDNSQGVQGGGGSLGELLVARVLSVSRSWTWRLLNCIVGRLMKCSWSTLRSVLLTSGLPGGAVVGSGERITDLRPMPTGWAIVASKRRGIPTLWISPRAARSAGDRRTSLFYCRTARARGRAIVLSACMDGRMPRGGHKPPEDDVIRAIFPIVSTWSRTP